MNNVVHTTAEVQNSIPSVDSAFSAVVVKPTVNIDNFRERNFQKNTTVKTIDDHFF